MPRLQSSLGHNRSCDPSPTSKTPLSGVIRDCHTSKPYSRLPSDRFATLPFAFDISHTHTQPPISRFCTLHEYLLHHLEIFLDLPSRLPHFMLNCPFVFFRQIGHVLYPVVSIFHSRSFLVVRVINIVAYTCNLRSFNFP